MELQKGIAQKISVMNDTATSTELSEFVAKLAQARKTSGVDGFRYQLRTKADVLMDQLLMDGEKVSPA